VIPADANGNRAGFRTHIKTDAASGTTGPFVHDGVIALAVQLTALDKDFRRARRDAEGTPFAVMRSDYDIASIGVAHNSLQNIGSLPDPSSRIFTVVWFENVGNTCSKIVTGRASRFARLTSHIKNSATIMEDYYDLRF
jgi:hypothetical protein